MTLCYVAAAAATESDISTAAALYSWIAVIKCTAF